MSLFLKHLFIPFSIETEACQLDIGHLYRNRLKRLNAVLKVHDPHDRHFGFRWRGCPGFSVGGATYAVGLIIASDTLQMIVGTLFIMLSLLYALTSIPAPNKLFYDFQISSHSGGHSNEIMEKSAESVSISPHLEDMRIESLEPIRTPSFFLFEQVELLFTTFDTMDSHQITWFEIRDDFVV